MASGLGIDYAADHEEIEADREQTITLRGRDVPALVSIPNRFRDVEDDMSGHYRAADLSVSIRDAVVPSFASQPLEEGEAVDYDGETYRIESVTHDGKAVVSLIECESEAQ